MTKQEFESMVGTVRSEDYAIIEYVYTWHPAISDTKGKEQIAMLFNNFGMALIRPMVEQAKKAEILDTEIRKHMQAVEYFKEMRRALRDGNEITETEINNVAREYSK